MVKLLTCSATVILTTFVAVPFSHADPGSEGGVVLSTVDVGPLIGEPSSTDTNINVAAGYVQVDTAEQQLAALDQILAGAPAEFKAE